MVTRYLCICLLLSGLKGYSQTEKENVNNLGISVPIIWNNSKVIYYSLGNPRYANGKGTSYGFSFNYSRSIYKSTYATFGAGYFKQAFGIKRPFQFDNPTQPLFHTQSYYYDNIQLSGGVGYRKKMNKTLFAKGEVTYNWLSSFRQKYIVNKESKNWQVNKKSMVIGRLINLKFGVEKSVTKKVSVGIDALLPILTSWNDDEIFYRYEYSDDTQKIAKNTFSIGTNVSITYHF